MNPGLPADDHVVSNMNVAGKADVVGNDGVVSDDAVMGDMDIGHQQIAVSDNSYSLVLYGSYRERAVFANNVIVTDNQLSFLAAVFFILRIDTDRCKGINLVVLTDLGMAGKNNMALQSGSFTDFNVGTDRAERTDDNVLRKFGLRIY